MEPPKPHPLASYLKEVGWGLLLVNLILTGVALLMAPFLGATVAFGLFAGTGAVITLLLVGVQGAFYLAARWFERRERW